MHRFFFVVIFMSTLSGTVNAATESDYDKTTTYAVLLGRAAGCGLDTSYPTKRVGSWIDRTFKGNDRAFQTIIVAEGMKHNAKEQAAGRSPDTCAAVKRAFNNTRWP